MNGKTLALLEFSAIRSALSSCALSGEAAERLLEALPLSDEEALRELKGRVASILDRMDSGDPEPLGNIPDIASFLPKLGVEGASLEMEEFYGLAVFVERGGELKAWLGRGSGLEALLGALPDCSAVSREIFQVLDREGKLRDLPSLRDIRRRIRSLTSELEAVMARYTAGEESRRMLRSELPSQRDGRAVLAVKANFRGRIRGIVHEVSATGRTLFIEPEEVVEKNNDILLENRRLDAEIRRILRELGARIGAYYGDLAAFHGGIISLECLRARARYSRQIRGRFAGEGALVLKAARHPLLGIRAIPIDLAMNAKQVIITGPNTGGKTVALKTVGLFALMNQTGLAVPAGEGTALPVFDGVYADIGDEQSLSQSLSTFSAHMTAIAGIAGLVTERSLVLLDELGSGTDPQEGSAIALAILDYLAEKGCRVIVTTHHGALKNYGYTRSGVENASVEFDGATLSPTYRIVMGIPGESRAVDIAARNGLPDSVVRGARSYLEGGQADLSALITELKTRRQDLEAARAEAAAETERLREERRRADLRELRLRQKELELKTGGLGQFQQLLREARRTLENLVRELREGVSREKTLKVKDFLKDLAQAVDAEEAALEEENGLLREERQRMASETGETSGIGEAGKAPRSGAAGNRAIAPGMEVLAGPWKRRGTVIRRDREGWAVEVGSLRMTLAESELSPLEPSQAGKRPLVTRVELNPGTEAKFELSLRGMRLDEALEALRRQIDAAVLSGLSEFAVIHGKGDGVLQRGVHDFLKQQSQVADYYFSRPELGGFGRTEVILKR
jgi:DNA mismatch repair protein MutS2